VVGFCFGGTYSFKLAAVQPELSAAVPFYGMAEFSDDEAAKIKPPILAFYGDQDQRLIDDLPAFQEQMKKAGVNFTSKVYPNAKHAFFNDTNPITYNDAAAKDAWQRTLNFLNQHLR
jgi:carboxymethylenebutenolidase